MPRSLLESTAIGQRVETTFGQSGFFGYGFCSSDPRRWRDVVEHPAAHGIDAATFRAMGQEREAASAAISTPAGTIRSRRSLEAAENIVVTATLDVATLPTWSRKRTLLIGDAAHATSPHAGQGASLALEDAMRLGRLMQDGRNLA